MDTIFGPATAPGKSGVGVIRISGPHAVSVAIDLGAALRAARRAERVILRAKDGQFIDDALAIRFDAPKSFTGEDVVELQHHGSVAVRKALLSELTKDPRCRLARAGEFTERAYVNGKLDLAQVEGLADVLDAETEQQLKLATGLLTGQMGRDFEVVRSACLEALAWLEGVIDFAEEEDVPTDVVTACEDALNSAQLHVSTAMDGIDRSRSVREGFTVALIGPPNAGKSTLLNWLAGRDVALTSPEAGTTRDALEVRLNVAGYLLILTDLAGLRDGVDGVEAAGIRRATEVAKAADLRIHVHRAERKAVPKFWRERDILLSTHRDQTEDADFDGVTGAGVDTILSRLADATEALGAGAGIASHERHRSCLLAAYESMEDALTALETSPEIAAFHVRQASSHLDMLVGNIEPDAVLGEIFGRFCVGK
ncbi:MAG: tRNA uridine-5-carboxymethylaminomethyl(34) synthesis GTPase MnmE [Shimia sp.]